MKPLNAHLRNFFSKRNAANSSASKLVLAAIFLTMIPQAFANTDNKDSDGDGLPDVYEEKIGTEAYLSDTDGDGIKDGVEVGDNLEQPLDSDNDKRIDALDYDDDNDGLPTFLESRNDTDKDGIKDYLDTDSDNDGLVDGIEAGALNKDANLDGIDDAFDSARLGAIDNNGDGIDDNLKLPDHNNDGIPDYLDTNYKKEIELVTIAPPKKAAKQFEEKAKKNNIATTSNDLNDKSKRQADIASTKKTETEKNIENSEADIEVKTKVAVNRYTDSDNDGLLDSQELILGTNIMKRDSDGDKVSDAIEIGMDINSPLDSDHDGLIDALDDDDDNDGVLTKFEDINKDSTPINDDTDQDGVPNYLDANDDGDSRLTKQEGGTKDSDGDGILDYLDKNDGVQDKVTKVDKNEEVTDEPEIVVLFDGNISSLPPQTDDASNDREDTKIEGNNVAEQAIENAVSNGSLDVAEADRNGQNEIVKNSSMTPEKKKGGFMQWLTSLLPD